MLASVIEKIKAAPKDPGIYIFHEKSGVLYVGKAANLRARLKSYLKITDIKTKSLHGEATRLSCIPLRSEIEALIEESRLIKELKPKYNVLWMDDKSYLYVYFTKEKFPKIFIGHEKPKISLVLRVGPFTDGNALRLAMKIIRRHFPYCTCLRPHLRDCLNAQIGKCPGFCCKKNENEIHPSLTRQRREYLNNIKKIKVILCGKKPAFAKNFDEAKEHAALEKIFEHQLYIFAEGIASRKQNTFAPAAKVSSPSAISRSEKENERTKRNHLRDVPANRFIPLQKINRVECYDISNFAGKEAVGAMTVLMKKEGFWQSDKSSYRKFKIKTAPTRDDPRMIYEVVSRRLNHPEWPYPDLIIIDGGITQLSAAQKAISNSQFPISKKIRIIGFAKPNKQIVGWNNPPEEIKKLAERAIYQTHNFVIRYHRKVRNKELFGIIK